jgi:hypothetical protein
MRLNLCETVNVLHIAKTTLYDSQTDAGNALDLMYNQYASDSWHYVDPATGESPDLHHAILYRGLGGGEIQLVLSHLTGVSIQ